jgi:hypothetical protein
MPIIPFLNGARFDPETTRVLGVALEMTCIALRTGDCDDGVRLAIAIRIIELAKAGERLVPVWCGYSMASQDENPARANNSSRGGLGKRGSCGRVPFGPTCIAAAPLGRTTAQGRVRPASQTQ